MTLTAFDDVVDGARKVDLTDAPGDARKVPAEILERLRALGYV